MHQIRIDTPDSNSSKTLIRTFESITSKNDLRQHPRYDTAATYGMSNVQRQGDSLTFEQGSILQMIRGRKYSDVVMNSNLLHNIEEGQTGVVSSAERYSKDGDLKNRLTNNIDSQNDS